jgi:tRNA(Ile)-lysidine synthase
MLEKVRKYIEEYDMLRAGDGVIVAVSGGADSVCLLSVLRLLAAEGGWQVRALHVNHGLRGEEAERDEHFVQELCSRWGISLSRKHFDVAAYAQEQRLSTEEAGRMLRYEALEAEADAWEQELRLASKEENARGNAAAADARTRPVVRIAIAHHADDQVETILHHLLRGSGMRGLSGMHPVQGRRIRPLLCVRREEIRRWLTERGQDWCEDSTNLHDDYTRNRIRRHLIPVMEEEVNARAAQNIFRAGELFAQADAYLEAQAGEIFKKYGQLDCERQTAQLPADVLRGQPPVIQSYLVRRMLDAAAPGQKDLTARHYEQIIRLAGKQTGAACDLPGGLKAAQRYGQLCLFHKEPESGTEEAVSGLMIVWNRKPEPTETEREYTAGDLTFRIFPYENAGEIPKNQYTKWFDYDKIKDALLVRTRQNGDYITLSGGGRKMLNRYMIDEKIPQEQRDRLLLLAEGSHVLWIIGYRISEYYKITAHTRYVLQVVKNGGENHV